MPTRAEKGQHSLHRAGMGRQSGWLRLARLLYIMLKAVAVASLPHCCYCCKLLLLLLSVAQVSLVLLLLPCCFYFVAVIVIVFGLSVPVAVKLQLLLNKCHITCA